MNFTGVLRKLFIWASLCTTAVYFRGPPEDAVPSRDMWAGGLGPEAQYVCAAPIPWTVQRAVDPTIKITLSNEIFSVLPGSSFVRAMYLIPGSIVGADFSSWQRNVSFAAPPWLDAAAAVAARIVRTEPEGTWAPETLLRPLMRSFSPAKEQHVDSQPFCVGAAARPLVELLRFGDVARKAEAVRELAKLADTSMACRSVVIEAGAVEPLVALVDTSHPGRYELATGEARLAWYHIKESLSEAAAYALGTLAAGDRRSYAAVVEAIKPVVARLEGGDYESREDALRMLHHMRRTTHVRGHEYRETVVSGDLLVEAGLVAPLVKLLRCNAGLRKLAFWRSKRNSYDCDEQQMSAAHLLEDLAWSSDTCRRDFAAAGAVPALFKMLDGRPLLRGSKLFRGLRVGSGIDALAAFARHEATNDLIVGKLNTLCKLLRDKSYENSLVVYHSIAALLWFTARGPQAIDAIVKSDALPALMASTHRDSIIFYVSELLHNLATGGSDDNKDTIISFGAVPLLVERSKEDIGAAWALDRLSEGKDVRRDIIESAGYVPVAAKATDAPGRDPGPRWKTWLRTVGLLVAFMLVFELIHDVTFVVGPVVGTPCPRLKIILWFCARILMQSIPAVFSLLSRSSFLPVLAGVFLCGAPGILCARPTALALLYVYGALGYMMLTGGFAFIMIVTCSLSWICVTFPLLCCLTLASNIIEALRGSQRGFLAGLKADLAFRLWQTKNFFDFHSMYDRLVGDWERKFHIRVPRWSILWSSLLLPSFVAPYVVLLTWSFGFLPRLRWASFVAEAAFFFWLFVSPLLDAATRTHVSVSVVGAFRPIFHEVRETLRLVFLRKSPRVQPDPGDACIVCHEEFGKERPGDFDDATQLAWCDWGCGRLNGHEECMREVLKRKQKAACLVCSASWRPLSIETKSDRKKQKYETQFKFFMYCFFLSLLFVNEEQPHLQKFVDGTYSVRAILRNLTVAALSYRIAMPEMPPLFGPPP